MLPNKPFDVLLKEMQIVIYKILEGRKDVLVYCNNHYQKVSEQMTLSLFLAKYKVLMFVNCTGCLVDD